LPDLEKPEAEKCYADTASHCIERFLEKEIDIFRPCIIFCFGGAASEELLWPHIERPGKLPNVSFKKIKLYHPNAPDRSMGRLEWDDVVTKKDEKICQALAAVMHASTSAP
jgi:uracil-DNA glycosylase